MYLSVNPGNDPSGNASVMMSESLMYMTTGFRLSMKVMSSTTSSPQYHHCHISSTSSAWLQTWETSSDMFAYLRMLVPSL